MQEILKSFYTAWHLIAGFDGEIYGIIGLSIVVTVFSTLISSVLGIPLGILVGSKNFFGKSLVIKVTHTFMAIPPVVAGLIVYIILSRKGPMGNYGLLFTPYAMVIAQVLIIFPLITGLVLSMVKLKSVTVLETCKGLCLGRLKTLRLLCYECRYPIVSALLAGYGRAMSEVGAVMLVGGNIQYNTRVMTTAIVLETGKGQYDKALALGIILLAIAFLVNFVVYLFREDS